MTCFYTSYGIIKAVDDVDLKIGRGEMVAIAGESGCGKSTTANSIVRLIPKPGKVVDGDILFEGRNLLELNEKEMRLVRGKRIGMIFQDPATYLNPVMRVEDQVAEPLLTHEDISKADARKKVVEILTSVGIPSPETVAKHYPHQLSGGMRQRVMIAMGISCTPNLLIADEPTSSLDVTVQAQILTLLKKLMEKMRMSVLLITHDLGVVAETCDRLYMMYAGKICEYGNTFEVFENAKHPYTSGLLDSALSIDRFKKEIIGLPGSVPDMSKPPKGCRYHSRCSQVKPICRNRQPPLVEVSPEHGVNCWLYG